jgi:hypothetical protein
MHAYVHVIFGHYDNNDFSEMYVHIYLGMQIKRINSEELLALFHRLCKMESYIANAMNTKKISWLRFSSS